MCDLPPLLYPCVHLSILKGKLFYLNCYSVEWKVNYLDNWLYCIYSQIFSFFVLWIIEQTYNSSNFCTFCALVYQIRRKKNENDFMGLYLYIGTVIDSDRYERTKTYTFDITILLLLSMNRLFFSKTYSCISADYILNFEKR